MGIALAPGCKKKEGTARKAAGPSTEYLKPDLTGRYKFEVKFPPKSPCRVDLDCGLTQLRPGDCCPDQCAYTSAHRTWIKALRKLHYPVCVKFLKEYGFEAVCGRPPCKRLPGQPRARCKQGKCVVEYVPFRRR